MIQRMSPVQKVIIALATSAAVVAICATVILAPASPASASVGDPVVGTVAGVPAAYFNKFGERFSNGRIVLLSAVVPAAVTQVTISYGGSTSAIVDLSALIIPSTGNCATDSGNLTVLRRVDVPATSALELNWNGPALHLRKAASGMKTCFIANVGTDDRLSVGVTGYKF